MSTLSSPPPFVDKLTEALNNGLKVAGIDPVDLDVEPVPQTKLYRFIALSPCFEQLKPSERQDLVWRIADGVLARDEQLCVSMILTLTPDEAGVKQDAD